jgi:hypothetical protein
MGVRWIRLSGDRDQWRAVVTWVLYVQTLWQTEHLLWWLLSCSWVRQFYCIVNLRPLGHPVTAALLRNILCQPFKNCSKDHRTTRYGLHSYSGVSQRCLKRRTECDEILCMFTYTKLCRGFLLFLLPPFIIQSFHYKTISTTYVV